MKDLMIDLETMGTKANSAIIAIGAVFFDRNTGETGNSFYQEISLESCQKEGMVIDASTIIWWMQQSDDARSKFINNGAAFDITTVLEDFSDFIDFNASDECVTPWGNGATFDLSMLESAFNRCGIKTPWAFWNVRDVRTVVDLCDCRDRVVFDGVPHYALDDAKHQVKYVVAAINKLTK